MTDEHLAELAQLYRKWNEGGCNTRETARNAATLLCSIPSLLAEVDFLRLLLHDMKEDSTAYRRGLEDGVKRERQRCLQVCADVERWYPQVYEGHTAVGAMLCAQGIRDESVSPCLVCGGKGYTEEEADIISQEDYLAGKTYTLRRRCPACRAGTSSASTPSPSSVE